jgi:hypothetical protein
MFQIEVVGSRKWAFLLSDHRLQSLLYGDEEEFWRQIPDASDDDQAMDGSCLECGGGDEIAELWCCAGCGRWFHATCCDYENGSLCKEVQLGPGHVKELDAYCSSCLKEKKLIHDDVVDRVKETRAISVYLSDPECPFQWEEVEGDGYCIFRNLETFAKDELGYHETSSQFCGDLADAALKSIEVTQKEAGEDAVKESVVTSLKKLKRGRRRVEILENGFWREIEVQHLLLGYVEMFPDAQVVLMGASQRGWAIEQGQSYGNGDKILHLLQWRMAEHYDRLVLKNAQAKRK